MREQTLIVSGIRLPVAEREEEAYRLALRRLKGLSLLPTDARCAIYRRSVDARHRDRVSFVYAVAVTGSFSDRVNGISVKDVAPVRAEEPSVTPGQEKLSHRPAVVGTGPAGLFCAYLLALHGYRPLVLERGGSVSEREGDVARFCKERVLDPENNIQFGAGGAGTFSDGKLVCRVNDPMTGWLLKALVAFGAPREITTQAKPHIGTDYLRRVVDNVIAEIVRLGGEIRYRTRLDDVTFDSHGVRTVFAGGEEIPVGALVLALGNSARDTFRMLLRRGVMMEAKPISVGVRIEHLQEEIDRAMYGRFAEDARLGHAEYHLSYDTANRGVYTFCMCPGGTVVAAASEEGGVVVNGMSDHSRSGKNANSAVVVSVKTEDFGNDPLRGMDFQRKIEEAAFLAGGKNYAAPVTVLEDFLNGTRGKVPTLVKPTYMNGEGVRLSSPDSYLPYFAVSQLQNGIRAFGKQIRGFDAPYAVLTGAETRTSCPLRILRGEERHAIGHDNLYPCGEGAGYAGGITSAAIDGLRTAMAIISRYQPLL